MRTGSRVSLSIVVIALLIAAKVFYFSKVSLDESYTFALSEFSAYCVRHGLNPADYSTPAKPKQDDDSHGYQLVWEPKNKLGRGKLVGLISREKLYVDIRPEDEWQKLN